MTKGSNHVELCGMLDRLAPGFLPRDVFDSIARLVVTVTYVVVPLLQRDGRMFALLHQRSADERCYPSLLNTPGTVFLASDADLAAVHERLMMKEMPEVAVRGCAVFVENVFDAIPRGRELSLLHWVELENDFRSRHLYDVSALPENVVPTDRPRIERAASHFLASRQAGRI
jgi:hypothetical protein